MTNERSTTRGPAADQLNSALDLLGARAWPGPERNPRIEEAIMNQTGGVYVSKRKLLVGGLLLLLGGTAIGAVTTTLVRQQFTGVAIGRDGTQYEVKGELIEQTQGDQREVSVSLEGLPDQPIQSGELKLEDGRVLKIQPVDQAGTAAITVDAPPGKAPAAKPEKK